MPFFARRPEFGRSPLTDPRSLGASAAFHVALLAVGSLALLGVSLPEGPKPPAVLNAEVGPVDNRVPEELGGGSPGDLGGMASIEVAALATDRRREEKGAGRREGAAETLLSDVLPAPAESKAAEGLPSGPATTGLGLLPGEGPGGGNGSGGGSGGGQGPGIGPGTEFFGTPERASSFAFVIDYSGSMSHLRALQIAKAELLSSLDRLPPDAKFAVVFYNMEPTVLPDPEGRPGLMAATADSKGRIRSRMESIRPLGGTDHAKALRAAIALKPEVIYFLTDAEKMAEDDAESLRGEAGSIRIQAVEFGDGPATGGSTPLRTLATATGGTFRHVDLSTIGQRKP